MGAIDFELLAIQLREATELFLKNALWTLDNLLIDDTLQTVMLRQMVHSSTFLPQLMSMAVTGGHPGYLQIIAASLTLIIKLADKYAFDLLLAKFEVLELTNALLQKGDSNEHLTIGLNLLRELCEKGELFKTPNRISDNPVVARLVDSEDYSNSLDSLTNTKFNTVYKLLLHLYQDFLPHNSN